VTLVVAGVFLYLMGATCAVAAMAVLGAFGDDADELFDDDEADDYRPRRHLRSVEGRTP